MKNGTRIFLIIFIIILLLGYVVGFVYCTVNKYASAEEIPENEQILNFNQLFNNNTTRGNYNSIATTKNGATYTVTGSFTGYRLRLGFNEASPTIPITNGHKYYLDYKLKVNSGNTPEIQIFNAGGSVLDSTITTHIFTASSTTTVSLGWYVNTAYTYNFSVTPMLIDLTAMFGVNSEPDLEKCTELFIAEYYSYTTGTPIYQNSFNAYNEGMNYILNSISTSVLNFGAFSSAYIYKNLDSEGYIDKYIDYEVYDTPYFLFKGYLAVPLNRTVKAGEIIEFTYSDPGMGGAGGDYLWAGILYNDSFVPVSVVDEGVKFSFVCPFDTQIFMLSVSSSTERFEYFNVGKWVGDFTVSGAQIDLEALIQAGVEGYKIEMQDYYANYYGKYGEGYAAIYDVGKADGITEANTNMNVMQYMKTAFITIGEILMIEVFPNFTLGSFFMLPIITSAIFFVIKIAKGGGD